MDRDPKAIVRDGYDRIGATYASGAPGDRARDAYLALALRAKPAGARCLDLGCGAGSASTAMLAGRYEVVGVDISPRSIEIAQAAVPAARFVVGDMTAVDFDADSFDLVTAFYSIVHVPSDELDGLLRRIADWLRPGGLVIATIGTPDGGAHYAEDWHGAPMFWSGTSEVSARDHLIAAGFVPIIVATESVDEGDQIVRHVWAVARRLAD